MKLSSIYSLTAIAVLSAPVAAQGILPYLPKDTIMAMSAPDITVSLAEFQQMPMAKMWAEEEVQTFFADIMEMVEEQMDDQMDVGRDLHEAGQLPVSPDDLMKLRIHGATFAITGMSMTEGPFGPSPNANLVAHMDFGTSAPTWNMLMQMGLGIIEMEAADEVVRTDYKIGEVQVITLAPPEELGLGMSINLAMVPNGILIATQTDDIKSIVTNMNAKTPVLATAPGFEKATKRISTEGSEVQFYMSPDPIMDFGMSTMRMMADQGMGMEMVDVDGLQRAMQAMGMSSLGTMASASSYVDGKSITKTFQTNYAASTGTAAAPATIDTSFLRWVPKDAVSFSASTWDIAGLYDMVVKGMQAYNPQLAEQALSQLAMMEEEIGFSLRKDLFGSFGDHYITWSMPVGTISAAPEMVLLVKVNSEEKIVSAMKNMAAMSQGAIDIEEGTRRGVKSYQINVNMDMSQDMGINIFEMIQPTFAFKNGYMVMGFSTGDVKRVFKRMDREDIPKGDIRGNKEFAAVADMIPSGVSSVSFTDWKANFESYYQLLTGVLAFVPMPEDVPIDMSLLPDSETLTNHLFGSISYTKTDAAGTESVAVSPFGPETLMFALTLGAVGGAASIILRDEGF